MMMALHARVQVLAEDPGNLGAFMTRLNKATCAKCPSNRFITFFFCILDTAIGGLKFANAGHNPPIVIRASGEAEMLEGGGPPLGILAMAPFAEQKHTTGTGRSVGAVQRRRDRMPQWSTKRSSARSGLSRCCANTAPNRPRQIADAVTSALLEFAAGAPPADDITLVVAKRL